jgi:hypothetical protein
MVQVDEKNEPPSHHMVFKNIKNSAAPIAHRDMRIEFMSVLKCLKENMFVQLRFVTPITLEIKSIGMEW